MQPVIITTDSTADLPQELLDRYNIHVIPLRITLGEESYFDGVDFTVDDLYARYHKDGSLPKPSAPNIVDFYDFFKQFTDQGYEVVHLDISSELSNSYNAAALAGAELPGVYVVDSRMLSVGIGVLAIEGAECRDRGMSAADIAARLRELTAKTSVTFMLDTLDFIKAGGRCSGLKAFGANLLHIKPCLEMRGGKIEVGKKYRGHIEKAYMKYVDDLLTGRKVRKEHVFFVESGEHDEELLQRLMDRVRELTGCRQLHRAKAGCTISSHCGPRAIGVMFIDE